MKSETSPFRFHFNEIQKKIFSLYFFIQLEQSLEDIFMLLSLAGGGKVEKGRTSGSFAFCSGLGQRARVKFDDVKNEQ